MEHKVTMSIKGHMVTMGIKGHMVTMATGLLRLKVRALAGRARPFTCYQR